jgi:hypothetical protein
MSFVLIFILGYAAGGVTALVVFGLMIAARAGHEGEDLH